MTRPIFHFILACAAAFASIAVSAQESKRFQQDRFAIGYWVGPQTSESLRERYREIAEANFTLVIGSHGMDVREQLALCGEFGLKAPA